MNHLNINNRDDLIKYFKPAGIGLELGVYEGEYSKFILDNCPNLILILMDCWQEQEKETYKDLLNSSNLIQSERIQKTIQNTINNYDRMRLIKGFSDEFYNLFSNEIFDFIYIDGNHSYESVKKDLKNWYPKIKKGGLFCGHDYVEGFYGPNGDIPFGVKPAVNEFANENNIQISSTNENWPSWFFVK
jgi:predicted transcriptional regulator